MLVRALKICREGQNETAETKGRVYQRQILTDAFKNTKVSRLKERRQYKDGGRSELETREEANSHITRKRSIHSKETLGARSRKQRRQRAEETEDCAHTRLKQPQRTR